MAETRSVRLPNGQVVENVPVGMSQVELQDKLIQSGRVSADVFAQPETPPPSPTEDLPWYRDIYNYVKNNLDLPAGIAGGIAGARYGAQFGPKAAFLTGVAGGATSTFGGTIASDLLTEEEVDYEDAFDNAMMSAGFDVATLGAFKLANPMWTMVRKNLLIKPEVAAEQAAKEISKGLEAGTPESLRATQEILQEKGATLTRFQTGLASAWEVFAEKLGEAGLFSGREAAKNLDKVNKAVQESLNDVTGSVVMRTGDAPNAVGEAILDIVSAGRSAASDAYGEGLDEIIKTLSKKTVDITPLQNQLLAFKNQNSVLTQGIDEAGELVTTRQSLLSKDAETFINQQLEGILKYPNMTGDSLLKIDKMLTQEMKKFGDIKSPNYNDVAAKQMGDLQNNIKQGVLDILKQTDPKAATQYEALKNSYSTAMKGLLPEINARVIKNAEKGQYDALGRLLTTQGDVSKINNMLSSVDNAYRELAKREGLPSEIAYGTAKEAKKAIRQSFIKNLVPNLDSPNFDIAEYANLSTRFSRPAEKARLKAIMGEDYARVNQLFNAMAEASNRPDGNLGVLFLRSKEFQSSGDLLRLAQGALVGSAGVTGGIPAAVGSAAVILGAPIFLSKLAYSPKAVNRLLTFNKTKYPNDIAREKAAMFIISDVMDAMTDEEQAELRTQLGL